MDVETLRLEREEKRRQRRERIRRILEDDDHTPTRRTREERETDLSRTAHSTPTTRRVREHVTSTTSGRRHISEDSSVRSTRTSRLRENTTSIPSSRGRTNVTEDSTTRSTGTRRLREERTTAPSERSYTRTRNTTEGSPTQRTTQSPRLETEKTDENGLDSMKARREARRKRNQQHDYQQNKITVENGEVDNATTTGTVDHSSITRDEKSTEDKDLQQDNQDGSESSKEVEGDHSKISRDEKGTEDKDLQQDKQDEAEGSKEHKLGKETTDSKDIVGDSDVMVDDKFGKVGESSKNTNDKLVTKESDITGKGFPVSEIKLMEIEKLDAHAILKGHDVPDKNDVLVEVKVNQEDDKDAEFKSGENDQAQAVGLSVIIDQKQDDANEEKDITQLDETTQNSEDKTTDSKVDKRDENVEDSCENRTLKNKPSDMPGEKLEKTATLNKLPTTKEDSGISDLATAVEDTTTLDVPTSEEPQIEVKAIQQLLETSSLQPITTADFSSKEQSVSVNNDSAGKEKTAADQELVNLEDLSDMPVFEDEINESTTQTVGKPGEEESTKDSPRITSKEVVTQLESVVDGMPQGSEKEPEESSQEITEERKIASPDAPSPKKSKLSTEIDEDHTKFAEAEASTKSGKSRTKSDESEAKNDRLRTKSDITRTKSADSGTMSNESGPNTPRAGKLKVSDDSWKKNVRKKRGVPDVDRAVELTVLGRTGKMKDKLKTCETRDIDSADQWKREVKKGSRKHKSLDEETEKELRQLPSKYELKDNIKSREEKDRESADAWKREVKKDVRKHKSLDEDTENELREISKSSILKSRIKECEKKDKESAEAWKKEVKKEGRPKDSDEKAEISEDLKEFSGSGRLKGLISSCAERDEKRDKSWESAKEKQKLKAADEQAELQELASLSAAKSKIIQQCEERDKESAEAGKKKIKSGEETKSFDETTDEELKELAKTVDVKTRIQSRMEESKEVVKRSDPLEDEELKEIDLKVRLEAYKQESEKHVAENKDKKSPSKVKKAEGGRTSPNKADTSGRKSPNKDVTQRGRTSPTKGDSGRISPAKDRPRSSSSTSGKVSPSKDRGRTSPIRDNSSCFAPARDRSRTSPTIGDSSGRVSPTKDRSRTKADSGRTSPSKDVTKTGRTSPTKRDTSAGRVSPSKDGTPATKRDIKGRMSPTKDTSAPAKSKLESIRANLYEGSKTKIKNKRESLNKVAKSSNIKDKIAACKERDKMAPRTITLPKSPAKAKAKPEPDTNTLQAGDEKVEENKLPENEEKVPVNRMGEQFTTIEEEIQGASIKSALSFWNEPSGEEITAGRDSPPKDSERPAPVIISNIRQGWQKRKRKLSAAEFIKQLLNSDCKRRELKDIEDVKSETKKYLVGGMHAEEIEASVEKTGDDDDDDDVTVKKNVQLENRKNSKKTFGEASDKKTDDEFSLDDLVNPDEVKQLRGFSNFRRQVRPANRRAAKSNPVRKLQEREDIRTGTESFNDEIDDEDEQDARLRPTAIGRLGGIIEPGDRNSRDSNQFAADALAGLAAKEDVSKITLKKTSKSRSGVSQEKREHDGTAPVMLLQIKGHRHMQTRLVEPSVDSLNSADSFILVTEKYLHVWNGKDSNVMKKSKATELSNKILQYKLLNCTASVVTIIKDGGVNVDTGLTRTFWNTLGGKKAVKGSKDTPKDGDYEKAVVSCNVVYAVDTSTEPAKIKKMPELSRKIPKISMLDSNKAFIFDFGSEVYAWLGRTCDKTTRTEAVNLAREVYNSPFEVHNSLNPITPNMPKDDDKARQLKRPSWALFGRMTERAETLLFEQKFSDWPDVSVKMKMDKEKDLLNKNLSKGYAKRMAKIEKSEYQAIELVPYDGAKMREQPAPVKLILEGVNVGRGRGSYDEIERRGLSVITNSVTVYHSSEKESRQLEEKEWGHFYSAESYVIRWSYSVKASGIRSLKGGESKRDTTGRDQIAYFFWHGRDCSASGKGTSALATIELDSDKSPQIMVDEGHESACFLNMFDGQMVVHHGKPDEAKSVDEDNVVMYCVHHEDEREICLTQIEARSSNLRSRSSFIVVVIDQVIGVCVWHGAKTTKEKKEGALRGAKRLATWFQGIFDINKVDMVELEEGHEGNMFWEALDGKDDYGSLKDESGKCDNPVRLFTFLSTEGPFLAREILNSTRGEHVSPYPFRQANLYDATQPALFLMDAVHVMFLWQGWWPVNGEESESATTTGSAEFRWHSDRKLAMQSIQSYADTVGRQMSKAYVVNAGLEPVEFRALFPFWEDHPDVTKINLESGKVDGKKESMTALLAKLSRDRYTLAELLVRPLPEGVDPLKMEMYLSDEEFQEVFKTTKDEFTKLPKWKKLEQRKKVGLF